MPRILIADARPICLDLPQCEVQYAHDGVQALQKMETFAPELVITDLMLPRRHGIEILKVAKQKKMGVILTSAQPMIQNYHAALESGADYFLRKPFDSKTISKLIRLFFEGKLKPAPFEGIEATYPKEKVYAPAPHIETSYLKFWGTRGSTAVSGTEYLHYGGNTVALEVRTPKNCVIIDAGTGIRLLGKELLQSEITTIPIFIGHTHWDHLAGLPFFAPLFETHHRLEIFTPSGYSQNTRELFMEVLGYSLFPVRFDDLASRITFHELQDGDVYNFGDIRIETTYAHHPGATLCFKITLPHHTLGYVTDNELLMGYQGDPEAIDLHHPLIEPHLSFIDFFRGCDTLIHEAQYTPEEYPHRIGWGHSSVTNAAAILQHIKPKEWIVTHHSPSHTDEALQKKLLLHMDVAEHLHMSCATRMAYDGFMIPGI
jgi:ribonuclease BN (tRNA processing enzyme)